MSKKIIHEHKIPKSIIFVLYIIAITLTLNLVKPLMHITPALAELGYGDRIEVEIVNWDYMPRSVNVSGKLSTCEVCQ